MGASGFFSWKAWMRPSSAASMTPNSLAMFARRGNCRHGNFGLLGDVVLDHAGDIHAVDMIAAEDRHHFRVRLFHQVDVLVDGVGRSLVPRLVGRAHLRRHGNHELALQQTPGLPSFGQVLQQRLAAELSQHINRVDSRVEEITQHEIDDPVFTAERHGRFGPFLSERKEAGALASRQHDPQYAYAHRFYQGLLFQASARIGKG
jgi:hypothetical protein